MDPTDVPRAIDAALLVARAQGLQAREATPLSLSNKLILRLRPCDAVARVGPAEQPIAALELDLATRLVAASSPVVAPDPRVSPTAHVRDGFEVSLWTWIPRGATGADDVDATSYATALARLHTGLRTIDVPCPRFTDRVRSALDLLEDPRLTPMLAAPDRALLRGTLEELGAVVGATGREQLLHGEPHPGNILVAAEGPLFIDLETVCSGPIEFDVAHAPPDVARRYRTLPDVQDPEAAPVPLDAELLAHCRHLTLALATTWRFDAADDFPDGLRVGAAWLRELREGRTGA